MWSCRVHGNPKELTDMGKYYKEHNHSLEGYNRNRVIVLRIFCPATRFGDSPRGLLSVTIRSVSYPHSEAPRETFPPSPLSPNQTSQTFWA